MKLEIFNQEFKWIGDSFVITRRGNKYYYEAFSIGTLKIKVGDYALVRNDDALDPEDITSCYIIQVKSLFDRGENFDPHQARVQWFSRIPELPTYAVKDLNDISNVFEIIQEKRSTWSNVIDAETIFHKCEVLLLGTDDNPETVLAGYDDYPYPVFFCRYAFTGTSIIPVLNDSKESAVKDMMSTHQNRCIDNHISVGNDAEDVTPKKKKPHEKKNMYCATLLGDSEFPKVLIKKIDDKILESKNGGVRILVADSSNDEAIEKVTERFREKLKLENSEKDNLIKSPIIHKFSASNGSSDVSVNELSSKNHASQSDISSLNASTPRKKGKKLIKTCPLSIQAVKKENLFSPRSSPRRGKKLIGEVLSTPPLQSVKQEIDTMSSPKRIKKPVDVLRVTPIWSVKKEIATSCSPKRMKKPEVLCATPIQTVKKETATRSSPKRVKKPVDKVLYTTPTRSVKKETATRSPPKRVKKSVSDVLCTTPKKKLKVEAEIDDLSVTRSGRKVKSVNYNEDITLRATVNDTPKIKKKLPRFVLPIDDSDESAYSGNEDSSDSSLSDCSLSNTESKTRSKNHKVLKKLKGPNKTPKSKAKNSVSGTPSRKKLDFTLSIPDRKTPLKTPKNFLEESRQRLHVSAVPNSLPCREKEYSDIYSFVKGCLNAQTGGCMYISGVPGTGKTATVHEVIRNLEEEKELGEVPIFKFVEVNGMWMTDPYQSYVHIFKSLMGETIAPQQAANLLEKRFTEPGPKKDAVVLLVDELDRLWTRKQTVMYNIFDWPSKKNSKLVVLAIANTMDLPERLMMNRIASRLGLTRKTFQPYTFKQLQEIIMSRIQELKVFDPDAVQLVSRKVAAISGDARRALDICRFATEVVKPKTPSRKSQKVLIGMEVVDIALQQMFSSPLILAIRSSSKIAKLFFKCIVSEFTRTGLEETTLSKVYQQVVSTCRFEGIQVPNFSMISNICAHLAASHLILVDNFQNDLHMKLRLNVSADDVIYALTLS